MRVRVHSPARLSSGAAWHARDLTASTHVSYGQLMSFPVCFGEARVCVKLRGWDRAVEGFVVGAEGKGFLHSRLTQLCLNTCCAPQTHVYTVKMTCGGCSGVRELFSCVAQKTSSHWPIGPRRQEATPPRPASRSAGLYTPPCMKMVPRAEARHPLACRFQLLY
jgi:hypothetical protein